MTLLEKLSSINKPPIRNLPCGEAHSIEELWENLIMQYLPQHDVVLAWHDLLMNYIKSPHPTFAIRGFNSFSPQKYSELRRGFLTNAGKFSFFYTDNFFAAYVQKMAIDGYVPKIDEFITAFKNRKFPSRFGRNTSEERELLAVKQGKDPKINGAGFKVAHIIPVGREYNYNNHIIGINEVLKSYFPKGTRNDWRLKRDCNDVFYERDFTPKDNANKYAIAHFLRFVHPFNYFLCPKKSCESNDRCKELSEYPSLLNYVHDYNLKNYGDKYLEFLSHIMLLNEYYSKRYKSEESQIWVRYGLNIDKSPNTNSTHKSREVNDDSPNRHVGEPRSNINSVNIEMAIEYLNNPHTSFRKLEVKFLHIDSAARGGGFVSKGIINSLGIKAEHKGILQYTSLEKLMLESQGQLLQTLQTINSLISPK